MMTTLNKDKDKLFVKANQDFTTQGQTFFGGQTYCWVKKTRQKICCGKYMELYYLTGPTDGCAFDNAIPVESSYVTLTITIQLLVERFQRFFNIGTGKFLNPNFAEILCFFNNLKDRRFIQHSY